MREGTGATGRSPGLTRRALLRRAAAASAAAALAAAGLPSERSGEARAAGDPDAPFGLNGVVVGTKDHLRQALDRIATHRRIALSSLVRAGILEERLLQPEADETLSPACTRHAAYLIYNDRFIDNPRQEIPDRPGFSEEGRAVAQTAFILSTANPRLLVDYMMGGMIGRRLVLDPRCGRVAFGCAWKKGSREGAGVLAPGADWTRGSCTVPVLYPAPGQDEVPLEYLACARDLMPPEAADLSGYCASAFLFGEATFRGVEARMLDARGKEVECWSTVPENPALPRQDSSPQSICLVPKSFLRKKETYRVRMSATLEPSVGEDPPRKWEADWKFTAAGRRTDLSELYRVVWGR